MGDSESEEELGRSPGPRVTKSRSTRDSGQDYERVDESLSNEDSYSDTRRVGHGRLEEEGLQDKNRSCPRIGGELRRKEVTGGKVPTGVPPQTTT